MALEITETVNEKSSAKLRFRILDDDGTAIPDTSIDTATLTLTVKGTDTIINNRDQVDISDMFDVDGWCIFELSAADNTIQSQAVGLDEEAHLVTIEITTVAPDPITKTEEIIITVVNLEMIN